MSTSRVHHAGVTVTDLDRAVDFYRDVLGLPLLDRFSVDGEAFSTAVGVENATGSFAHLDGGSVRVELVQYDPKEASIETETVNQPGATHLGLSVDDLDAFFASLPETVETLSEPRVTASGTKILFVRDPEGNLVELLET